MSELNDLDLIRDTEERYRRLTWHVRDLNRKLELQEAHLGRHDQDMPAKRPAWVPMLLTAFFTLLLTYISIVHGVALRNRAEVDDLQRTQNRNIHLIAKVDDVETRLRTVERLSQQLPGLAEKLNLLAQKLEEYIDLRLKETRP